LFVFQGRLNRLSAQKSLAMPDTTTPVSIERAEKDLLFGFAEAPVGNEQQYKIGHKWGNKPAISLLNDYQKLMVYLFSDETAANAKYKALQKATSERVEPPETKLDLVKELWERILPHRELIFYQIVRPTGHILFWHIVMPYRSGTDHPIKSCNHTFFPQVNRQVYGIMIRTSVNNVTRPDFRIVVICKSNTETVVSFFCHSHVTCPRSWPRKPM